MSDGRRDLQQGVLTGAGARVQVHDLVGDAEPEQRFEGLGGRQRRGHCEDDRQRASDVRGRHRGAAPRCRARVAAGGGGLDALARCEDVDKRAVVREGGHRIVAATRPDCDGRSFRGWRVTACVSGVVACCDGNGDARSHQCRDGSVHRGRIAAAERQGRDAAGVNRLTTDVGEAAEAAGPHEVNAGDHPGVRAGPAGIEHLDGDEARVLGHAVGVPGGGPRAVRAVAIAVLVRRPLPEE
mmetsp:Transcript_47695/g.140913  ORF Transcript_47695/g.140913 Transcript_47695/m.140913 type:complete len:240 (-) Transcript_47695:394-1113(-)